MKRCIENQQGNNNLDLERSIAIANYLLVLSHGQTTPISAEHHTGRVFECKTCNRQFPSFQALGGHRASHKKPRLSSPPSSSSSSDHAAEKDVVKGKVHECSICGLEFGVGQALGGHMRRHRAALTGSQFVALPLLANNKGEKTSVLSLDLNLTPLENEKSYFCI